MNTLTLAAAVDDFLSSKAGAISSGTLTNYRYALSSVVAAIGPDTAVTAITARQMREWRGSLAEQFTPATINARMKLVKGFFNWLVDDLADQGIAMRNPAKKLQPYQDDEREIRAISPEAINSMLDQAHADRDLRAIAIIKYLYSTGGRVGGLIRLKMKDIDLDAGTAVVLEKGAKRRTVYLEAAAVEALRDYIAYQRPSTGTDHVFLSRYRAGMTNQSVYRLLQVLAERAGVSDDEPTNPHAFRHAFAIGYLKAGGDLSSLRNLMGHSSTTVTDKFYAVWSDGQLKAQHEKYNPLKELSTNGADALA